MQKPRVAPPDTHGLVFGQATNHHRKAYPPDAVDRDERHPAGLKLADSFSEIRPTATAGLHVDDMSRPNLRGEGRFGMFVMSEDQAPSHRRGGKMIAAFWIRSKRTRASWFKTGQETSGFTA